MTSGQRSTVDRHGAHSYAEDPQIPADFNGKGRCVHCGRPATNRDHRLPATPPGALEHDAAVNGEHDIEDDA